MRCISLLQPWASLVVIGAKKYETRSWKTSYRGTLLIHASKRFQAEDKRLATWGPFATALWPVGAVRLDLLPLGAIIGRVDLVGCHGITANELDTIFGGVMLPPTEPELSFGDYRPGRYAWRLENPVRFETPIPWKGSLGLYDVRPEYLGVTRDVLEGL